MSQIEFSDNNVVTMHFEIESLSVSYGDIQLYTSLYCNSIDITITLFKHSVLFVAKSFKFTYTIIHNVMCVYSCYELYRIA